jgi:hypothetical protein
VTKRGFWLPIRFTAIKSTSCAGGEHAIATFGDQLKIIPSKTAKASFNCRRFHDKLCLRERCSFQKKEKRKKKNSSDSANLQISRARTEGNLNFVFSVFWKRLVCQFLKPSKCGYKKICFAVGVADMDTL